MRELGVVVIFSALAAWAQSSPPPLVPLEAEAPPVVTSCKSARDCPLLGQLCELPLGPASRGVCSPPRPPDATACITDAKCGGARHCGEHKLLLEQTQARWMGICLPGPRTPAHGPRPVTTSYADTLRFEYEGTVPAGYVLHDRPDMRLIIPGIGVFAGSYVLSQMWFLLLRWNAWSLVPLAGPLIQFFTMQTDVTASTSGAFNVTLLTTIGQVVGATAIAIGFLKPIRWLERSPVAIVPSPGGMSVVGAF